MAEYASRVPAWEMRVWATLVAGIGSLIAVSFLIASSALLVWAAGGIPQLKTLSIGILALWLMANFTVMTSVLLPLSLVIASCLMGAIRSVAEAELPNKRMTEYYFVKTRRQFLRIGFVLTATLAVGLFMIAITGRL